MPIHLEDKHIFQFGKSISISHHYMKEPVLSHNHDFLEITYLLSGQIRHIFNETEEKIFQAGDYILIDYGNCHRFEQVDGQPAEYINCNFKPEFLDSTLTRTSRFKNLLSNPLIAFDYATISDEKFYHFSDKSGEIKQLFEKMQAEYAHEQPGKIQLLRTYLLEIIILTMRKYQEEHNTDFKLKQDDDVSFVISHIYNNFHQPISLAYLASLRNISLSQLSKKFHAQTNYTFSDFVKRVRVDNACRLILSTNYKFYEIAYKVGYGDVKFFNTAFKAITGSSPRDFRKSFITMPKAKEEYMASRGWEKQNKQ